ncbi:MAG: hypothetical protein M1830_008634 [Pleopsidium flavum]|nr:MAG: hypothetical protein M1830_008634 [Pleopsidium flavum]
MAGVQKNRRHQPSRPPASPSPCSAQLSSPFDNPIPSQLFRQGEDDKLIIPLDFGSTFSAVAFARVPKDKTLPTPAEIHHVQRWKCTGVTHPGNEVLSLLAYQNRGPHDECLYWGFGVHAAIKKQEIHENGNNDEEWIRDVQIKRIKLAVSSSEETEKVRQQVQKILPKLGPTHESLEDLIADFLRKLWKCAKSQAVRVYSEAVTNLPIECVICIPAMWTQAEEQRMRTAVELAGLPRPHIVGEPEAAAVYMLAREAPSIVGYSPSDQFSNIDGERTRLHLWDTVVVCDAGGGTADLITYRITGISPLRVEELVSGAGDFCGSSDLNDHFVQWLREQTIDCGKWADMLGYMDLDEDDFLERLAAAFEEAKKKFSGSRSTIYVTIPQLKKSRKDPHLIYQDISCFRKNDVPGLTVNNPTPRDDMVVIFSKTVNRIVELIMSQIDRAYDAAGHVDAGFRVQVKSIFTRTMRSGADSPKRILLVGGYGESGYLYKELQMTFRRNLNPRYRVQVSHDDESATAIAKGGLLRAMHPAVVTERISRLSMSICWSEPYQRTLPAHLDKAKDEPKWCPYFHKNILEDRVRWLLKVHKKIPTIPREVLMERCVPLDGSFLFKDELWVSDHETEDSLRIMRGKTTKGKRPNDMRLMATINTDMAPSDHGRKA